VAFDMQTRDPDDALTLCVLATHPAVELVSVTLTPGTREQIGLVREILRRLGLSVAVGAREPGSRADAVSPFHGDWLGAVGPAEPDGIAHAMLAETLRAHPDCTVLTGAPLHNLRLLLRHHPDVHVARWVAQGGFAGDNVVPPEHRLAKFAGRTMCESFNFGGDKKGTLAALASPRVGERRLVSKNVTHGVAWDPALDRALAGLRGVTAGLELAREAMAIYLRGNPDGKLLHDPLAASALIDPGAFTWAEVEVVYREGQWGARPAAGTGTFITVAVDQRRALSALVAPARLTEEGGP
jgi:pyrimidine-specific ribonucleoside hydrolase